MRFLEKDLEDIIFETDHQILKQRGLFIRKGKLFRQLKIGNYGIADLVCVYPFREGSGFVEFNISIYELKQDVVDFSTYHQALRYARGIKSYIIQRMLQKSLEIEIDYDINFDFVLIGKSINLKSDIGYLPEIYNDVSLVTYVYDFDGIRFKYNSDIRLTDEGFKLRSPNIKL